MANENKKTGNPHCPPNVRRKKRIAHAILARAQAASFGIGIQSDEECDRTIDLTPASRQANEVRLRERVDSHAHGEGGGQIYSRHSSEATLVQSVTKVAKKFAEVF